MAVGSLGGCLSALGAPDKLRFIRSAFCGLDGEGATPTNDCAIRTLRVVRTQARADKARGEGDRAFSPTSETQVSPFAV